MNTSTLKDLTASKEGALVSDTVQYTITRHNKTSLTNVSMPDRTSKDKCFNSHLFSIYCKKFLSPADINHVDPEVIHFLRFLFMEGVGTFFADDNSNHIDNLASSELGDTIQHFLLAVKNGKNASDLHSSILLFLKYLLEHGFTESCPQDNNSHAKSDARSRLRLDIDDILPSLNRNNHRIVCIPTIQKLKCDLQRVIEENIYLCSENYMLKNKIRLQRKKASCECNKILQAIINYCEDQLEYCWRCRCAYVDLFLSTSMLCGVKQNEIDCIRKRNCRIRNANHLLKLTLKNLMDNPYQECDNLLDSVASLCRKKCPDPCDPCVPLCTSNSCRYSSCPPICRSLSPGRYSLCCSPPPKSPCCYSSCPSLCVCGKCCPPKRCSSPTKCCCSRCVEPRCYSTVQKLPYYCCKPLCCRPKPLCSPCSPPRLTCSRSKSCSPICCPKTKPCYCYPPCRKDPCCTIPSRLGAGCSTGGCGGYTPSGWNKLMSKARLMCDEKQCCCAPTCTCTDCVCGIVRRRPRCRTNLCKDFCNSQTSPQDECGSNNKNRPSLKLLGELAFQLERRILDYVFGLEDSKRRRFYGYTVSNIFSMMEKESKGPKGGSDVITKSELTGRLKKLLTALEKYGYNIKTHGEFAQEMVNKYGLLACPPDESTIDQFGLNDAASIACLIQTLAQGPSEISNFNILLNCLKYLSKCDKRPLFMW